LKTQKLDDVRKILKEQLLKRFLEMKRNIYPDLIRVFYTNLKFEGNNFVSHVNGVDMEITHEVWVALTDLKYVGLRINKGNIGVVEDFNKIQYYKSCLKNPHAQVRTCFVGGLKLNERLLALIVTWILTPRGINHSVLIEENLVYIYCIMSKVKINWIHIIKEHMQKSMRLSDYHYPYVMLISKFLNYFEVNLEDETSELVKSTHEVNNGSLSKMCFTKINGRWVSKDGKHGGSSSGVHAEHDEEDQEAVEHQGNRIPSMSSIERFMLNRLDSFAKNKEIFMIFVLQIFITLTTDFKAWTHVFRPLMNILKLFKTSFLSCSMGKKIKAKFIYLYCFIWTILFSSLPKVYL